MLGALFAAGVWYKYAYDLRESAGGLAESAKQWDQVKQVLPGLVLGFFEVTVLTSISVAISTRLPMLANLVVCILIFFLGHLSPVLVEAGRRRAQVNELVGFMAKLFAWALPVAGVLQRRPVDLDRCGHPLGRLRLAGIRLLRVVQWSSVVVRVPLVRGPRPGLIDRRAPVRGCRESWLRGRQSRRLTVMTGGRRGSWWRDRSVGHDSRFVHRGCPGEPRSSHLDPKSGDLAHASRCVSSGT